MHPSISGPSKHFSSSPSAPPAYMASLSVRTRGHLLSHSPAVSFLMPCPSNLSLPTSRPACTNLTIHLFCSNLMDGRKRLSHVNQGLHKSGLPGIFTNAWQCFDMAEVASHYPQLFLETSGPPISLSANCLLRGNNSCAYPSLYKCYYLYLKILEEVLLAPLTHIFKQCFSWPPFSSPYA